MEKNKMNGSRLLALLLAFILAFSGLGLENVAKASEPVTEASTPVDAEVEKTTDAEEKSTAETEAPA